MNPMIDLRSDTLTKPTAPMLRAMFDAEVGDEQKGEDPTVSALEHAAAELLGHDTSIFVPSASMANQIALNVLGRRGDEVLADRLSHVFLYEMGGPAAISGLVMKPIEGSRGTFTPDLLAESSSAPAWYHSGSSVVSIENTHAESGGVVWDAAVLADVVSSAHSQSLGTHLDGARVLNAAIASGQPPDAIAAQFDTVTMCLSKGLGCPVGAVLATSAELEPHARRIKQMLGGAMRQAGYLAAAGLYALAHHVVRLADDHAAASMLAQQLTEAGVPLINKRPATNIVLIDLRRLDSRGRAAATAALGSHGVALSSVQTPGVLRAVTHLGVSHDQISTAARRISAALQPYLATLNKENIA